MFFNILRTLETANKKKKATLRERKRAAGERTTKTCLSLINEYIK